MPHPPLVSSLCVVGLLVAACAGSVESKQQKSDADAGRADAGGAGAGGIGAGGAGVGGTGVGGGTCGSVGPVDCFDSCVGMYAPECVNGTWRCMGAPNRDAHCVEPCTGALTPPVCVDGHWTCLDSGCTDAGPACPPVPSCNWCGGLSEFDANGCVIGFRCWNGADPCATQPCQGETDCSNMQEHCGVDGLCSSTGPTSCSQACAYDSDGTAHCTWDQCSDAHTYASDCSVMPNGTWKCRCSVDAQPTSSCYWNNQGSAGGPADYGNVCCPFPWP